MLFKAKDQPGTESRIILGMVLLKDNAPLDLGLFLKDVKNTKKYKIGKPGGDKTATTFTIDDELVAIGFMPVPIPWGDLESAAKYAYNWETVLEDVKNHHGHLIVSIIQGANDPIKRYRIFTSVISSLLRTNNAIGVFMGNQSLLISKEDYIDEADGMTADWLPLNLWIYFGLRTINDKSIGYTYGLKEFNKEELEILDSEKSLEDIRRFLYNIAHYILDHNVQFKSGQTCGISESERIAITLSPGQFVASDSFKLAY